jgi:hypothetical protein
MALDPERLLMALSGDLAGQGKRLEALEELNLGDNLGKLREQMAAITAYLEQLAAEEEEEEPEGLNPAVAPDWDALNSEQLREAWDILVSWLQDVLYPTYARPVWRPCWFKHPVVFEELAWLCAYWHWAYKVKGAPPSRAADWHQRCWPHVKAVLEERFSRCYVPEHGHEIDVEAINASMSGMRLTEEQQQRLDALHRDSTARLSSQAVAEPPAGRVRIAPRHAMVQGRERDFADDAELSEHILREVADRKEREATEQDAQGD